MKLKIYINLNRRKGKYNEKRTTVSNDKIYPFFHIGRNCSGGGIHHTFGSISSDLLAIISDSADIINYMEFYFQQKIHIQI